MLNEVRKESLNLRKTKTSSNGDDEEEDDNEESNSPTLAEEWTSW
jgi:hypothetical protein